MKKNHVVQSLVMNTDGSLPKELFCRGDCSFDDGKLIVESGNEVSFNTYFNLFFAAQWKEVTEIKKVRFFLKLQGTGRVQVWRSDSRGNEKLLEEVPFALEKESDFFVGKEFSLHKLGHACWLRILAHKAAVCLSGGSIVTTAEPQQELDIAC